MKMEGYNTITIVLQCGEGLSVPFAHPSKVKRKEIDSLIAERKSSGSSTFKAKVFI